jgi:hypothetical protein
VCLLVVGILLIRIYRLLVTSWFFSRLSLLLAIIRFAPAGLVVLAHFRALGGLWWWDKSDVVWTTRRSRKVEKVELVVMSVLWSLIFIFVIVLIFALIQ